METQNLSREIKIMAGELGFFHCGIAKAKKLEQDAVRLEAWLNSGYHGKMAYMENHFDLRVDPAKLVPGAKSVITLLLNYFPETQQDKGLPRISKYAYGQDYHEVIREKLNLFLFRIREIAGDVSGRGFVDSAPVLERAWARESGLGWIGRNGNLISKTSGSFFFIATLVTDLELHYDDPYAKDYCGSCRKCIEACPTDAILENRTINGSQCISYFTIELKEMLIPGEQNGKFDNWMFGCDTCQDVCPWNRFSKPHNKPSLTALPGLLDMDARDWEELGEEQFRIRFRHSPLKRSKYRGILRNIHFISNQPAGEAGSS